MSYFIQDNAFCLRMADGHTLFFVKGGSNNTFDWEGRRLSEWWFQMGFKDQEDFERYLDTVAKEFRGGDWQFNAILRKDLDGYFAREAYGVERLRKAYRNAMDIPVKMSEITETNVVSVIKEVIIPHCERRAPKSGRQVEISLTYLYDLQKSTTTVEKEAFRRLTQTPTEDYKRTGLANFFTKWAKFSAEELVMNKEFCQEVAENGYESELTYSGGFGFLTQFGLNSPIINDIPYENIKALMLNEKSVLKFINSMEYGEKSLSPLMRHWKRLVMDDDFMSVFNQAIESLENGSDWDKSKAEKLKNKLSNFLASIPNAEKAGINLVTTVLPQSRTLKQLLFSF